MRDCKSIWERWYTLINTDSAKKTLDLLHLEVHKGFDVITQISIEELQNKLKKELFDSIKEDLEMSLAICIWNGYALFLTDNNLDPVKDNFVARTETNELGNKWMENYTKDQSKELLMNIDPVLSMFLEKVMQNELNKLFYTKPEVADSPYKEVGHIENFYIWASHQGYILGLLENQLQKK